MPIKCGDSCLYISICCAAGGDQWAVPEYGKKWNFTTQAFGVDDYCAWYGVICCVSDQGAANALYNGAVISAGRSAWSTFMPMGEHGHSKDGLEDSFDDIPSENLEDLQGRHDIMMV